MSKDLPVTVEIVVKKNGVTLFTQNSAMRNVLQAPATIKDAADNMFNDMTHRPNSYAISLVEHPYDAV